MRPPYALADDAPLLRRAVGVHTDVLPCPYLGSPTEATVYVLNVNPSYTPASASYSDPHYLDEWRRSLTFGSTYPFQLDLTLRAESDDIGQGQLAPVIGPR